MTMKISLSGCKCPRCKKKLSIVHDECDMKNGIIVGYCYNPIHPRLKIKTVNIKQFRTNSKNNKCSMKNLKCIICGGKLWPDMNQSSVNEAIMSYDCPVCKTGLRYLGKTAQNIITYDEIIRVLFVTYRFQWLYGMRIMPEEKIWFFAYPSMPRIASSHFHAHPSRNVSWSQNLGMNQRGMV